MPRIIVTSDPTTERPGVVTLDERVASADLRSEHHAVQLVERVGWAVHDADDVEQEEGAGAIDQLSESATGPSFSR
jgi:hypothetical protein